MRTSSEAGFSLIEVLVAFTVLALVFTAVEWTAIGSTTASVTAAQRAEATSLAAQAIAETQALPFADLQAGLNCNQLQTALQASDPPAWSAEVSLSSGSCSTSNSQYFLTLSGVSPMSILVANNATGGELPIVPFSSNQQLAGVTYSVGVFPTTDPGNSSLVTVTALVGWSAPPNHQQNSTVEQVEVGAQ